MSGRISDMCPIPFRAKNTAVFVSRFPMKITRDPVRILNYGARIAKGTMSSTLPPLPRQIKQNLSEKVGRRPCAVMRSVALRFAIPFTV